MASEGVIRFSLQYASAPPLQVGRIRELNAWRRILYLLQLIGQNPSRYEGLGYGNISRRLDPQEEPRGERPFVISGTQTGGLMQLGPEHYSVVLECRPGENRVTAEGPIKPSAEALTHATLYKGEDRVRWVMHVHSPEIWRNASRLGLPATPESAPYGSPELAREILRLLEEPGVKQKKIIVMGGHEDGLLSFGETAEEAGSVLLASLARAFEFSPLIIH